MSVINPWFEKTAAAYCCKGGIKVYYAYQDSHRRLTAFGAGFLFVSLGQLLMSIYQKPFLTFEEQVKLLEKRGLQISDPLQAQADLARIGYYRLSAYWYPFRERLPGHQEGLDTPSDTFRPGYASSMRLRYTRSIASCA